MNNDPVSDAKMHLAKFPNSLFTFKQNVPSPHNLNKKTAVLCVDYCGKLHPVAFDNLTYSQFNEIDQLVTDHCNRVYNESIIGKKHEVFVEPNIEETQINRDDIYKAQLRDIVHPVEIFDEEDENDEHDEEYDEDNDYYAEWQQDLNEHEVPAFITEQARRTQAINDETIFGKMTEYHQVQTGHYPWGPSMINLFVEAAMIASIEDRNTLIGEDGRTRLIPGHQGPTSALIVDNNGTRHDLMFVDHRLRVTDINALDQNGKELLSRANTLLLANMKRQVLEIAEALRFIEPKKKNVLGLLGEIVGNLKKEDDVYEVNVHGMTVLASLASTKKEDENYVMNITGTINKEKFSAVLLINDQEYMVEYVYSNTQEQKEAISDALHQAEAYYRRQLKKYMDKKEEQIRQRVNEYIPAAKELAKRLGDEIREVEQALAKA